MASKIYLDKEGLELYDSLIKAKIANDIATSQYDDTDLKEKVSNVEGAITTLNGEGDGSVKKQVSDAVASIIAGAPESRDTLKEISDWLDSHANDAIAMNSQINTNKTDIATLTTLIGQLPEGAASTTIVAYIAEAINTSQTDLVTAIETAKSEAISTSAADAATKANQALSDAKTYTDDTVKSVSDRVTALETSVGEGLTAISESDINALFDNNTTE